MKEFVFLSTLFPLISQVLTISSNGLYRGASDIGIGVCYPVGGESLTCPLTPLIHSLSYRKQLHTGSAVDGLQGVHMDL